MPRKPIDYSNTHFYKIVCKDLNITDCYVGHTTDFTKRKNAHKNNCLNQNNRKYNSYLYVFIRNNGGVSNFDMILLEKISCESRLEALKKEREYIELLQANLNQINPHATENDKLEQCKKYNEWKRQDRIDNPEKYKEIDKLKYIKNRETLCEKARNRYIIKKDEINEQKKDYYYNRGGKEKNALRCKRYKEEHREEVKLMMNQWYNNMKEEIICECGQKLLKHNLPILIKRKKHQEYLKALEQAD